MSIHLHHYMTLVQRLSSLFSLSSIDFVAIKLAFGTLAFSPLSNVSVSIITCAPNHRTIRAIIASVSLSLSEHAFILTLTVGPDVSAISLSHVVFEGTLERSHVVVVLDRALTIQTTIIIPNTIVQAASNLDLALADQFASTRLVVGGRRPVSHGEQPALLKHVFVPLAFNDFDVSIVKFHFAFTVQLIVRNRSNVLGSALPLNLVLTVHGLVLKCTAIDGKALLVVTRAPLSVDKGAIEPALSSGLQI